jgi:hypothetical protein
MTRRIVVGSPTQLEQRRRHASPHMLLRVHSPLSGELNPLCLRRIDPRTGRLRQCARRAPATARPDRGPPPARPAARAPRPPERTWPGPGPRASHQTFPPRDPGSRPGADPGDAGNTCRSAARAPPRPRPSPSPAPRARGRRPRGFEPGEPGVGGGRQDARDGGDRRSGGDTAGTKAGRAPAGWRGPAAGRAPRHNGRRPRAPHLMVPAAPR